MHILIHAYLFVCCLQSMIAAWCLCVACMQEARAAGKKFDMAMVPIDQQPIFKISPEKAVLESKE